MPIYAYRCEACGFAKDVLQKVSDPQLTVCLSCNAPSFKKQVTAAGFQLKGTGWYATDFRNGAGTTAPAVAGASNDGAGADGAGKSGSGGGNDKAGGDKTAADNGGTKGGDKVAAAASSGGTGTASAPTTAGAGGTPSSSV